ncbi:hypothetical protein K1719_032847 [Acacia pycnantha]|nr:hypothetical protein K1719_032847 [Acacia pycnantha]
MRVLRHSLKLGPKLDSEFMCNGIVMQPLVLLLLLLRWMHAKRSLKTKGIMLKSQHINVKHWRICSR